MVTVDITPGRHVIDLSYRYNVFSVDELPNGLITGGTLVRPELNVLFSIRF
jgi:hypothetical protein